MKLSAVSIVVGLASLAAAVAQAQPAGHAPRVRANEIGGVITSTAGPEAGVWVSLGSGHLESFDRRQCRGPLNGPTATGDHCPEGWSFYRLPGPSFASVPAESVESSYYTWVDQHVTLRIPYPLGFYAKGMEGRIDDPKTGWKGRGL